MHVKPLGALKLFEEVGRGHLFAVHKRGVHLFVKVWRIGDDKTVSEAAIHLGPDLSLLNGVPTIYSEKALAERVCVELPEARFLLCRDLRSLTFGKAIAPGAVLIAKDDAIMAFLHRETQTIQFAQLSSGRIIAQPPGQTAGVNKWAVAADDRTIIAEYEAPPWEPGHVMGSPVI